MSGLEQAGDAFTAKDLTEAERLRLVYEILTGLESDGGANISPGLDDYVESITPLHNDEFNKVTENERDDIVVLKRNLSCRVGMDSCLVKKMVN